MEQITSSAELKLRIMHLQAQKFEQEEGIQRGIREFTHTLNPFNFLRSMLSGKGGVERPVDNNALMTGVLSIIDMVVLRRPESFKKGIMSVGLNMLMGHLSTENVVAIKQKVTNIFSRLGKRKTNDFAKDTDQNIDFNPIENDNVEIK